MILQRGGQPTTAELLAATHHVNETPAGATPSSTLLADDSTNIVDIIISFASSLFLATPRRPTPAGTLDAPTLPAAALPRPR